MSNNGTTTSFITETSSFKYDRYYGDTSIYVFILALIAPLAAFITVFVCFYRHRRKNTKSNCQMYSSLL